MATTVPDGPAKAHHRRAALSPKLRRAASTRGRGRGVPTGEGLTWVVAEAWWAASSRQSGVVPIVGWVADHAWNEVRNLLRVQMERCVRLATPKAGSSDPAFWARGIDLINSLLLPLLV